MQQFESAVALLGLSHTPSLNKKGMTEVVINHISMFKRNVSDATELILHKNLVLETMVRDIVREKRFATINLSLSGVCTSCNGIGFSYVPKSDSVEFPCTPCHGSGFKTMACNTCTGTGAIKCSRCSGYGFKDAGKTDPCPQCNGSGIFGQCKTCKGSGKYHFFKTDKQAEKPCIPCEGKGTQSKHFLTGEIESIHHCIKCDGHGVRDGLTSTFADVIDSDTYTRMLAMVSR